MYNPCETPGMKIRSKGMGRGEARGMGRGPIGIPTSAKGAGWTGSMSNPVGRPRFGRGRNPIGGFRKFENPLWR